MSTVESGSDRESVIRCSRLDLHHVSPGELIALDEDPSSADVYSGNGFTNPYRVLMEGASPVRWRAPQVRADPTVNKWFVRWMVLRETKEIVGSISFHGPPDGRGMLEVGLGVHPVFQRRGFAREALLGMWQWASQEAGVQVFRYTVAPENTASVALIDSFGFARVGQQIDPEDGPEDIYEMAVSGFLATHGGE